MYHIELADKAANYSYMALFSLVFLFVGGAIDIYAMSKFNFFIRDEEIGEGIINYNKKLHIIHGLIFGAVALINIFIILVAPEFNYLIRNL